MLKRDSSLGKVHAHKQENMVQFIERTKAKTKQRGQRKNILIFIILLLEKWRPVMSWTSLARQIILVVEILDNRRPCLKKKL